MVEETQPLRGSFTFQRGRCLERSTEFNKGPTRSAQAGERDHTQAPDPQNLTAAPPGQKQPTLRAGQTAQGPTFSDHLSQIPMGVSSRFPRGTPGNLLRKGLPLCQPQPLLHGNPSLQGPTTCTSNSPHPRQLSQVKTLTPERREEAGSCGYSTKKAELSHSPFRELDLHTHNFHIEPCTPLNHLSRYH